MEGGACEVLPIRKRGGGAKKGLAMLKGGHKKFWGSFYAVAWSFEEGALKGGCELFLPCLEGVGAKSFGPAIFPFCSSLPVINDQCLKSLNPANTKIDTLIDKHSYAGKGVSYFRIGLSFHLMQKQPVKTGNF